MNKYFETIASIIRPSYIDELWLAHKPWLRNEGHHYMAYVRWYKEPRRKGQRLIDREWTWAVSYSDSPVDAMSKLLVKVSERFKDG